VDVFVVDLDGSMLFSSAGFVIHCCSGTFTLGRFDRAGGGFKSEQKITNGTGVFNRATLSCTWETQDLALPRSFFG
jgi:hypothetical protein